MARRAVNFIRIWEQKTFHRTILIQFLQRKDMRFGIVVSDWNHEVTWSLLNGATSTLLKHGVSVDDIIVKHVPGSFELDSGGAVAG
jgi:6,7-dimethyl-8-ribityllumazine synthase